MLKSSIFIVVLSLFVSCSQSNKTETELQSLLDSTLKEHPKAVGIILHIRAPDKNFSWSGAVGYANRETKEPLQLDQPGRLASSTKTFVAATIMRLIEMEKIRIDQSINELLHERTESLLTKYGYKTDSITLGQLLSHKSGMPSTATPKYREKEKNDLFYRWTRDEKIQDSITMMERGEPGLSFSYSDLNYLLLSEIIEQQTGTSFYLAMRELLDYEKIGLQNTWFYTLEQAPKNVKPRFYQYIESRDWADSHNESITWGLYGPMGLVSTAEDMALFMEALFSGRVFEKRETLDQMLSDIQTKDGIETEFTYYERYPSNYYMGLEGTQIGESLAFGHTGYWGSWMAHFPEENVSFGLFILNGDSIDGFEMELIRKAVDIIENN